ncbi:MAG: aminotransferase class I/II-fold pyridoxal phosphate-dependent enzyme [Opitutaceae bacterium]
MRTILVTGSDTDVGKTQAVASLARLLAGRSGDRIQIIKAVETGVNGAAEGDAARALRLAGDLEIEAHTLASFPRALAPAAAAALAGEEISMEILEERAQALPRCDWRLFEGAGGIGSPIDDGGRDWADFAVAVGASAVVIVVADRIGAINQGRLAFARAVQAGLRAGVWLNAVSPADPEVAQSNRTGLRRSGVPIWGELGFRETEAREIGALIDALSEKPARASSPGAGPGFCASRCDTALADRERMNLRRRIRVTALPEGVINLADNDYLGLSRDPAIAAAVADAAREHGASASASPLITGWRQPHEALVDALCAWHRLPFGLLWTSGYAANSAVLETLPQKGDIVLADRLIHHSMIAGLLHGGARIHRYPHLDLDRLEAALAGPEAAGRPAFVVTESVFSMDGDYPDMARLAELKRRHGFCWILDEAHALGWYGPEGAGLARATAVQGAVDVLVGTLGKTLASGGAYTLFRDSAVRDYLVNKAGGFIYSTAPPPANAAGALAAIGRVRELSAAGQDVWQENSRRFRAVLREGGWDVPVGESPVVPVRMGGEDAAVSLASALREAGILVAAVRPPTVPAGTSRLRLSMKRTHSPDDLSRVAKAMAEWRAGR